MGEEGTGRTERGGGLEGCSEGRGGTILLFHAEAALDARANAFAFCHICLALGKWYPGGRATSILVLRRGIPRGVA